VLGDHLAQFSFELGLLSPLSHISIFDYFDCVHSGTTPYLGGYRTGITEVQLHDAPEFSDDSWEDRDWEARIHEHYGVPGYWGGGSSM
jgi:hypothetical protein